MLGFRASDLRALRNPQLRGYVSRARFSTPRPFRVIKSANRMFTEGFPLPETEMYISLPSRLSSRLILLWNTRCCPVEPPSLELIHEYADYRAIPRTATDNGKMRRHFRAFVEIVRSDREPRINRIARKSTIASSSFSATENSLHRDVTKCARISIGIIFISDSQPAIDAINATVM